MKLKNVHVTNYKCIDDSEAFSIRQLTCLAGKNEAGKSALLQALRRLNPVEDTEHDYDELMEYPRRRRSDLNKGGDAANVLTTTWNLDAEDLSTVEKAFGPGALDSAEVHLKRGYENSTKWSLSLNEQSIVRHLLSTGQELTATAQQRLGSCHTVQQLRAQLQDEESQSEAEQALLQHLDNICPDDPSSAISTLLEPRLPRFLYFPRYATLEGKVSLQHLQQIQDAPEQQREQDRVFFALLKLAGASVAQIANSQRYEEQKAQLESVSNNLSDEIFEYWSQNRNLEVEIDFHPGLQADPPPFNSGNVIDLRIRNTRHRVTVPFDERSTGFVWFFSFLVYFSQMREMYGDNLIVLLDEPGLTLHGKAQSDLLRYMNERLLPRCQVIYTTHSPFMIDPSQLVSVRTVEDLTAESGAVIGTKVREDSVSADSDTLLPLRAALGYDITQSLFIGENSLLVEGPSDLLYLNWASRQLQLRGKTGLDRRWTITPVGSITKVAAFASLFGSNLIGLAVLVDYHHGEKKQVRALSDNPMLSDDHVFHAAMFAEQGEADIEDMIGSVLYSKIVNRSYELKGKRKFSPDSSGDKPIVQYAEDHFRTVAFDGPEFNHLTPAVYLAEHESDFSDANGTDEALGRFEQFFAAVNALLPGSEGQ
ncbi:MAG: AAA family ATPase [Chloroflexi bacterium]|nr:AAA family ATPase [Chloroflexota bacterium]